MKGIKSYILTNKDKWDPSIKYSNEYLYEEIKSYFDEIPNDLLKLYENNSLERYAFTYIDESLKTHDSEKLKSQLLKYYEDEIDEFRNYDGTGKIKSFWIIINPKINKPKLNIRDLNRHEGDTENFYNLLNFFNYTYREYEVIAYKISLFIEPIYSEEVSDKFENTYRQAYHFTYKENIEKILANGIRLKGKNTSIKYPKRIYLWADYKKLKDSKELNDFIQRILGIQYNLNNIGIIKVDLNNFHIPIYKDTAMEEKEAVFVYNNIPSEYCKEIKLK